MRLLSDGGPGRRTALLVSLVGMTLSNVAIAASQSLLMLGDSQSDGGGEDAPGIASDALQVLGTLAFVGAWASGVGTVPWLAATESFPQYARGAAVGAVAAAHWSYVLDLSTGFRAFVATFGTTAAFVGFAAVTGGGVLLLAAPVSWSKTVTTNKNAGHGGRGGINLTRKMHWTHFLLPEAGGMPLEDVFVCAEFTDQDDAAGHDAAKPLLPRTTSRV